MLVITSTDPIWNYQIILANTHIIKTKVELKEIKYAKHTHTHTQNKKYPINIHI